MHTHGTGEHDASTPGSRYTPTGKTREETIVDLGREALKSFITDVLFNPSHPASEPFREAALNWRSRPGAKLNAAYLEDGTSLQRRLLNAASAWRPQKGWDTFDFVNGQTFLSGELCGYGPFHLVVEQGRVTSVTLELEGVLFSEKMSPRA